MKKVLIPVDDSKGSLTSLKVFQELFSDNTASVVLLYVEKMEGRSLMDDMLGKAELSTLKEALKGTDYQKMLDEKAGKIIGFYKTALEKQGVTDIKTVIKEGHPAEEILQTAKDEEARLIIVGSRSDRMHSFFMGSVSREVANRSDIPVVIAR